MWDVSVDRQKHLSLRVLEAEPTDVGRGIARIDPDDLRRLGADVGDIVSISGKKSAAAKVLPTHMKYRGKSIIQIDGTGRENAGIHIDGKVTVKKCSYSYARSVTLSPIVDTGNGEMEWDTGYIGRSLQGLPVMEGNLVQVIFFGAKAVNFTVTGTSPKEIVLLHPGTTIKIENLSESQEGIGKVAYADIGGLGPEIQRIREMIELPLLYPD